MSVETRVVGAAEAGIRLDKWLAGWASVGSREKARQALRSGKVSVDGTAVGADDAGRTLAAGATVEIAWTRPGTNARVTAGREALVRAGLKVLHQDDAIVVVDKPAGLLTDAADLEQAREDDTVRKRLRAYVDGMVWPAHRLDRDTSGVVAFARTEAARAALKAQWIERTPERVYVALVEGAMRGDGGRFADWMVWDGRARIQRPCRADTPDAWLAEATWSVIERFGDRATGIEVRLVTGRRNQIRLHAQLAGHPLVGETLYRPDGARAPNAPRFSRQALHARALGFKHPATGRPVRFEAPLPDDLRGLLAALRG